jgi:S-methylmethionine-dependent homocysteine/selenocysteine methylase
LNEIQSHFDELCVICNHCDRNNIPYVVSIYVDDTFNIFSGENLESVFSLLNDHDVLTVRQNCISPELFLKIIGSIELPKQWGFYLNCGSVQPKDKINNCEIQLDEYTNTVKMGLPYKPLFIGSSCRSNPAHKKKYASL